MKKSYQLTLSDSQKFTDSFEEMSSGCWEWMKGKDKDGYGMFYANGGTYKAHRMSFFLYKGDPEEWHVLHHCDNPSCVNPEHLFLGTNTDNVADRHKKGRSRNRQEPGEAHHMSKLVEEQVLRIRADLRSQAQIAQDFGISRANVGKIKARKSWNHLP